jgi:hypothetical protein
LGLAYFETRRSEGGHSAVSRDILDQLREDKTFLATTSITDEEFAFLEQVELFGNLKNFDDVALILKNLRGVETSP